MKYNIKWWYSDFLCGNVPTLFINFTNKLRKFIYTVRTFSTFPQKYFHIPPFRDGHFPLKMPSNSVLSYVIYWVEMKVMRKNFIYLKIFY